MSEPFDITSEYTNDKALRDTTALMIGRMFKAATGSNELMQETTYSIGDDQDRTWGVAGTLMNLLYQYVTDNDKCPQNWQVLIDHLCTLLPDIPAPEIR
jgi:hypothetical protein